MKKSDGVVKAIFPFLRWFPMSKDTFRADFMAGLTVSLLLIPQAMAYAQLAGLPPHYGLYAAFIPVMIGALFGWCSQLHTGPVAMTSLLTFAVISQIPGLCDDKSQMLQAIFFLSFLAGVIQLSFGIFRLSVFVNFLSYPVVAGFTSAGAIIIAASQLPLILGIGLGKRGGMLIDLLTLILQIGKTHIPTLTIGAASLALIMIFKIYAPRFPAVIFTLLLSIAASYLLDYKECLGGAVAGHIPPGLPPLQFPHFNWALSGDLIGGALMIALIGFMEVLATDKAISAKTREKLDFNQELIGQGAAKIVGSFFQSFPVSGSFSRSALNLYSGAKTGLSSIFAGAFVLITLLFFTPLLYYLPLATLGAVIIAAVSGLINLRVFARIWKADRFDGIAALVTFLTVIILAPNVTEGVIIGVGFSIAFHLYRLMKPHVAVLAKHSDGTFRDAGKHHLETDREILIIRFEGSLVFANAAHFAGRTFDAIASSPYAKAVIFQTDCVNDMDATGEETLRQLIEDLRKNGMAVAVSEMKWRVMELLERTGFHSVLEKKYFFRTTEDAFAYVRNELQ
jgi:SulP family sulfate permease